MERHEGGCLCGAQRYRVSGPARWAAGCFCESCTKGAGAPVMAWAGFPRERVEWIAGERARYNSSPGVYRGFCATCGTSLSFEPDLEGDSDAADTLYVATRTLDDPTAYPPSEFVRGKECVAWLQLGGDASIHAEFSPAAMALMAGGGAR